MSEFVFLFRTTEQDQREHMDTPERAQKSMEAWLAWMRQLEEKGALKDGGQPLDRGGRVVRGSQRVVTDGPYLEAKDLIVGYIIVEARNIEEATELSLGCPMLEGAGSVEIRPIVKYDFSAAGMGSL